jgi:acyl-CoA thioester hydrolase
MGVLHHSRYLQLVEAARTESMRASGFPYKDLEDAGFFLVITHADLEYLAPVLYDDLLHIETRLDRISGARLNHSYRIIRVSDGLLCARVTTVLGCVDASGKPRRLPPEILNLRPAVGGSEKT